MTKGSFAKSMSLAVAFCAFSECSQSKPAGESACSGALFGAPAAQTGLGEGQCQPRCQCGGEEKAAPAWTEDKLKSIKEWTLENPWPEVASNPYEAAEPAASEGFCAMVAVDAAERVYRTQTFADLEQLSAAGGTLTHGGACGACSSLQDLAVYARDPDLGAPVRQCGLSTWSQGFEANVQCLEQLGFSLPCAQIWAWNTLHTRTACLEPCLALGDAPYHLPDGGLNACLACDEEKSGAVFKAVAGRTRRNTGVPSAICRPCGEAVWVAHDYPQ